MDGVSTYLALTFGTLLSSQGTEASFKTISGPSGLSLRFHQLIRPFPFRFPLAGFCFAPSGVSTTLADSFADS
jgi:hypothetical protein